MIRLFPGDTGYSRNLFRSTLRPLDNVSNVPREAPVEPDEVGKRVRYWRTRRGLSRAEFAARVGRSPSWVDKIESGERALSRLPMLDRVAEALNVQVDVLTRRG